MSSSAVLSKTRQNIVVNKKSRKQEKLCSRVIDTVHEAIREKYGYEIVYKSRLMCHDIVEKLKQLHPDVEYANVKNTTFLSPDGGITYLKDRENNLYPILIGEVKNQGVNAQRLQEGKEKQPLGNAIERLGKNIIGFHKYMEGETFNPVVCFGEGCDFAEGSFLLDRVHTISGFEPINRISAFNSYGSFFFREEAWTEEEMFNIFFDVVEIGIKYYVEKYGNIF